MRMAVLREKAGCCVAKRDANMDVKQGWILPVERKHERKNLVTVRSCCASQRGGPNQV
jgi:hypothetical protein